jgi:hypothetical protein
MRNFDIEVRRTDALLTILVTERIMQVNAMPLKCFPSKLRELTLQLEFLCEKEIPDYKYTLSVQNIRNSFNDID